MTARKRFLDTLNFKKPGDRLPMVEWAPWWSKTTDRWKTEGLPDNLNNEEIQEYFGLDPMICVHAIGTVGMPQPAYHGGPVVLDMDSYNALRPGLFLDEMIDAVISRVRKIKPKHDRGEIIVRLWLDGFFWFPRKMLGIESHMYGFYDQPDLIHKMNRDLTEFNLRVIKKLFPVLKPDMVGFAEDMSYNNGPMLSEDMFNEFLLPYYQQVIPAIKINGGKVLCDSDGDITHLLPWMRRAGIEGVYPLERQAGVDLVRLRREYPDFLFMGGYDKMVMSLGMETMRAEFERLLPAMRTGGYILSVDHQTPPGVSLEQYRNYLSLLQEYSEKAVIVHESMKQVN
ncbi:MAG: hypothetical protein FWD78_06090 [Treponema sp.]|nr:hypothetical protein [Treponema sp.]